MIIHTHTVPSVPYSATSEIGVAPAAKAVEEPWVLLPSLFMCGYVLQGSIGGINDFNFCMGHRALGSNQKLNRRDRFIFVCDKLAMGCVAVVCIWRGEHIDESRVSSIVHDLVDITQITYLIAEFGDPLVLVVRGRRTKHESTPCCTHTKFEVLVVDPVSNNRFWGQDNSVYVSLGMFIRKVVDYRTVEYKPPCLPGTASTALFGEPS